jgi:hypothetical protein
MTKKARIGTAIAADPLQRTRNTPSQRTRAPASPEPEVAPPFGPPIAVRGSEEEALQSLLSSVTDKLGDQGPDNAQLHDFLTLILETDPSLKEEILRGIRATK